MKPEQKNRRAILQEDNDPSHGIRSSDNLAVRYKRANNIELLVHPAQSPDLNPIEACWNILKQRVRRHKWENLEQLKHLIVQKWAQITMREIRARISDMSGRCDKLTKNGGAPIKSELW